VNKASILQLWNPRRAWAMKGNNIELNERKKEEPCVLVHVAKGDIFAMKVSSIAHKRLYLCNESIIHSAQKAISLQ
jgi:hypothetical protein